MKDKVFDSIKFGLGFYIGFNIARVIKKIIVEKM